MPTDKALLLPLEKEAAAATASKIDSFLSYIVYVNCTSVTNAGIGSG